MLTLNSTRTGFTLLPSFGNVCMTAQAQAITIDSVALRVITDNSRNGRFTDMLPLIAGRLTFIREVGTAASNSVVARYGCQLWPWSRASPIVPTAATAMTAMNVLVSR